MGRKKDCLDYTPSRMPAPTQAPAGSYEKIMVLRARAENNEYLYHPLDPHFVGSDDGEAGVPFLSERLFETDYRMPHR